MLLWRIDISMKILSGATFITSSVLDFSVKFTKRTGWVKIALVFKKLLAS